MLEYKGYVGKLDAEDGIFHGQVIGLRDVFTFEGETYGEVEEVNEAAAKRVLARSMASMIDRSGKSKAQIARDMNTTRSQVNRLLDEHDTGVTLHTIMAAAVAIGGRVRITVEAPEEA